MGYHQRQFLLILLQKKTNFQMRAPSILTDGADGLEVPEIERFTLLPMRDGSEDLVAYTFSYPMNQECGISMSVSVSWLGEGVVIAE